MCSCTLWRALGWWIERFWLQTALNFTATPRFSFALGAGAEVTVHGPIALRVAGDYQRTTFANSVLVSIPQNNVRLGTSLVYRFGRRVQ